MRDERVDEEGDGGGATPSWSSPAWALPLAVYGAVFAVLVVVSWQVITHITVTPDGVPPVEFRGEWFWDGWVRYGAGWYTMIVDNGYSYTPGTQSPGVLPRVPAAGAGRQPGHRQHAPGRHRRHGGVRCERPGPVPPLVPGPARPPGVGTALLCLALYPYAYYLYGAMYGDALFLLCAVAAFLAFERDHLVLAGLAGAVATDAAIEVAVVVGLVVGVCDRGVFARAEGPACRACTSTGCACVTGGSCCRSARLAAWSGWLWARYGDPLLFSTVQESWGQQAGPATWVKRDFFLSIIQRPGRFYSMGLVIQATFGLAVAASILPVARRFGWRYGAYVGALAGPGHRQPGLPGPRPVPTGGVPSFALAGVLLAGRPGVRRAVLPLSAAVLVVFTGMFQRPLHLLRLHGPDHHQRRPPELPVPDVERGGHDPAHGGGAGSRVPPGRRRARGFVRDRGGGRRLHRRHRQDRRRAGRRRPPHRRGPYPENRKLGGALDPGFAAATGDVVLAAPAPDLPCELVEADKALRLMRLYEADLVSAYRFDRTSEEGAQRAVYSYVYNHLVRWVLGVRIRDVNFAFKLIRRRVLDHVELRSEGSFIDAELMAKAHRRGSATCSSASTTSRGPGGPRRCPRPP